MTFTYIVECENEKNDGKIENLEQTDSLQEKSNDEDLQEAYDKLFQESLKLKKLNRSTYKRLHVLKLRKKNFQINLSKLAV